jgi:hypothetical protein
MGKAHQKQKKQLNLKAKQMHWLLGRRPTLSAESKLLLYRSVLMEFSYGEQPPISTLKFSSAFNPRLSDPF